MARVVAKQARKSVVESRQALALGSSALQAGSRARPFGGPIRHSPEPMYLRIANSLSEQIAAGVYRTGDRLPAERQLRAEYGVSSVTVRRAIAIMLDKGLVTRTRGKTTLVRSPGIREAVFRLPRIAALRVDDASVGVFLLQATIVPVIATNGKTYFQQTSGSTTQRRESDSVNRLLRMEGRRNDRLAST